MYGTELLAILLVLRVVIPVGLLLWFGEMARRRESLDFNQTPGSV